MIKKVLFLFAFTIMGHVLSSAKTFNGIIVYAEGEETAYLLSDMPSVSYGEGKAVLSINQREVATINLKDNKKLTIVYGEYDSTPTKVDGPSDVSEVRRAGKYYVGGRLIIIDKEGRTYDTSGKIIKQQEK